MGCFILFGIVLYLMLQSKLLKNGLCLMLILLFIWVIMIPYKPTESHQETYTSEETQQSPKRNISPEECWWNRPYGKTHTTNSNCTANTVHKCSSGTRAGSALRPYDQSESQRAFEDFTAMSVYATHTIASQHRVTHALFDLTGVFIDRVLWSWHEA